MNEASRPKKKSGKTNSKAPATAPGQALGYGLQYTRLTAMLLEAPSGSACSLEVLDDVACEDASGAVTLVQTKSALTNNPAADRAIVLWKTLFNWLNLAKAGHVTANETIFELYVSRQVEGELVVGFSRASTDSEAKLAVQRAREVLWGRSPRYADRAELPKDLSRYVDPVLEADDSVLLPIIRKLRLVCGSGSAQADIEEAIRRDPVSEARVFDIADKLCGWVKRSVDKQIEAGRPAVISRADFHSEYIAYVRSVDRDLMLRSWARKPSEHEKRERLPDPFVQQLDLIEIPFDEKLAAISDYLTACWDRAIWSKAGDVHDDSFVELNDDLMRVWANLKKIVHLEGRSQPAILRGQLLQTRCMMHKAKLQGMEVPSHFVPGCFHGLADDLVIGWHPGYQDLMKKVTEAT